VSFVPPLAVATTNPYIFVEAANFAGAYGMTTLYGIMPVLMAWKVNPPPLALNPSPQDLHPPTRTSSWRPPTSPAPPVGPHSTASCPCSWPGRCASFMYIILGLY
jgi:hypothetical protein